MQTEPTTLAEHFLKCPLLTLFQGTKYNSPVWDKILSTETRCVRRGKLTIFKLSFNFTKQYRAGLLYMKKATLDSWSERTRRVLTFLSKWKKLESGGKWRKWTIGTSQNKCDRQIILWSVVFTSFVSFSEIPRLRHVTSVEYDREKTCRVTFFLGKTIDWSQATS